MRAITMPESGPIPAPIYAPPRVPRRESQPPAAPQAAPKQRKLMRKVALTLGLLGAVGGMIAVARSLATDEPVRVRQVARIAVLPDTPPPPPPPERKPEPKAETRPMQQQTPVEQAPMPKADAPIKMEGAAGDGPSAFGAGAVSQDYQGGAPVVGGSGGIADRAQERLYANTVRQMLQTEIERQLGPDAGQLTSSFLVWITPEGRIARFEVTPGAAPAQDAAMRVALEASTRTLHLPPPPSAEPLRFRLTVRAG